MFRSFRRTPLLLCLLLTLALTACRTQMSLTYQIDNGEQIKVELNSSDGHKLSQEEGLPAVKKDGETVLLCQFLQADGFDTYAAGLATSGDVTIFQASPEEDPAFYFYRYTGGGADEYLFLLRIPGAETGVLCGGTVSKEAAEDAYRHLTFSKEG